jgi:hypothetical protein
MTVETKPADVVDLGCMNGWMGEPVLYLPHKLAGNRGERHEVTERRLGRCWTEYTCATCGIKWNVDSSG